MSATAHSWRSANRHGEARLPPGPRAPAAIQTAAWVVHPTRLMERCLHRYGEPFTIALSGLDPLVFTSDPQVINTVFRDRGEAMRAGEGNAPLEPVLGPHSLLLLDGAEHMRQRRLLLPLFHGDRMRAYGEAIREITHDATSAWTPGTTVDLHPAMQSLSMRVIVRAVFGMHEGERTDACLRVLTRFMEQLSGGLIYVPALRRDFAGLGPWARFTATLRELRSLLDAEIERRCAEPDLADRTDIMSQLLASCDDAGQPVDRALVREQLITLLAAGHETTATALVWAIRHLLANSEADSRLRAEIAQIGDDPGPSTVMTLPWLDAVCKETLRLFPIVPVIGRRLVHDTELGGRVLPAGVLVIPCIYLTHRRPDLYPQPERFLPERFLERDYAPSEFLPFGGGIRRCIGANFALYEMKIALARLVGRHRFALANPGSLRAVRRNVTLYPRGGVRVRIEGGAA